MSTRITEKYIFQTDIMKAYDGHEQRMKVRQYPRRVVSYDYDAMKPEDAQWLKAQLRLRQSDYMFIPMWHRPARMTENFYGGKILWADKNDLFGFFGAEAVLLWQGDDVMHHKGTNVQKIIGSYLSDGKIMLSTKLIRRYNKKNTWLYPLVRCTTQPSTQLNHVFANGTSVIMNFEDLLYDGIPELPYSIVHDYHYELVPQFNRFKLPERYEGREVLLNSPQWVEDGDNQLSIDKNTTKLDNVSGIFKYDLKNASSYDIHSFHFLFRNRAMIDNFIKFIRNMGGMHKSFWCPSWANDFNVVRTIFPGDNYLIVTLGELDRYYNSNTRKKKIVIFTNDWQAYIYDILNLTKFTDGGRKYGRIILSRPVEEYIPPSRLRQVSYFNLVRFDSDEFQIDYDSDEVAETTVVVREVDDLNAVY